MLADGLSAEEAQRAVAADADAIREQHKRTIDRFLHDGKLSAMPSKRRARALVLVELSKLFEPGRSYPEAEVNQILNTVHEDVAYLRREMVELGVLNRANSVYTLTMLPAA